MRRVPLSTTSRRLGPEKILANMEEWRWMPDDLGEFYVWVNIPEFTLRVVKNGAVIHTERVITGLVDKQTPVFSENMKTIVFQPRWNVPNSIKVKELWPSLARGGDVLRAPGAAPVAERARGRSRERRLELDRYPHATTSISRRANATCWATLKFAFPNKHDVYMHDTPNKTLFEAASRPFSHGCMRVRNPRGLGR